MSESDRTNRLRHRAARLGVLVLPLATLACASAPEPRDPAVDARVHREYAAALQARAAQDPGDADLNSPADFWGTGTEAIVDEGGRVVFRVPTSLVAGNGADAYAYRSEMLERERLRDSFVVVRYPNGDDPLLAPNVLRQNRVVIGSQPLRRQPQPAAAPASQPRTSAPRSMRSSRSESRRTLD